MCGGHLGANVHRIITAVSQNEIFPICNKCAMREYYGTSGKKGKRYLKDRLRNKIFGNESDTTG
jgi:Mrp family chromosome partitioning ATPase|tara:strand:- start:1401 stop:1592 length:192 start_codon:yes stop_codon:yes gene_type:complete